MYITNISSNTRIYIIPQNGFSSHRVDPPAVRTVPPIGWKVYQLLCGFPLNKQSTLIIFLLEKPAGCQLVKEFPALYRTWISLITFTNTQHLSLSWNRQIHSTSPPHSLKNHLILSSLLCLGLTSSLFATTLPTKICKKTLPHIPTCSTHLFPLVYKIRSLINPHDIINTVNKMSVLSNDVTRFTFRHFSIVSEAFHSWNIYIMSYEITSIIKIQELFSFIAKCWNISYN